VSVDLHARTVPLDYGPDPLQFDGSPTVLFDRPGLTLVGWGTAQLVDASEASKVLASIPCDDTVQRPGSGVVALGALPFLDALSAALIVPRFTMGIARDADGDVRRWATAVGPSDRPLPDTKELFDAVIWQYGTTPEAAAPGPEVDIEGITARLTSDGYADLVGEAVRVMRGADPAFVKVVLSRAITATLSCPLLVSDVLRRLRAHEPNCTIFSLPVPDGTFLGATPELLIAKHGSHISSHPLAGTVARGDTARSDADAQGRLAESAKEHDEHRYVVEDVASVLAPFCRTLAVPATPSLVAFRSVAHLGTRIEGELADATSVLELLEHLHPTPAVGGTPRTAALGFIESGEPSPRGYWAGPVGWVDAAGDGEWMIGIRSALLHPQGDAVTLQAGAGIVADSDAGEEAAEVNVKLTTVLDSLVPGKSAQLD
jgi:menaquinone-specific isochorismate synthase